MKKFGLKQIIIGVILIGVFGFAYSLQKRTTTVEVLNLKIEIPFDAVRAAEFSGGDFYYNAGPRNDHSKMFGISDWGKDMKEESFEEIESRISGYNGEKGMINHPELQIFYYLRFPRSEYIAVVYSAKLDQHWIISFRNVSLEKIIRCLENIEVVHNEG